MMLEISRVRELESKYEILPDRAAKSETTVVSNETTVVFGVIWKI